MLWSGISPQNPRSRAVGIHRQSGWLVSGELHVTCDGQDTVIPSPVTYAYGSAKVSHKAFRAPDAPCVLAVAFESPVDAMASESAEK